MYGIPNACLKDYSDPKIPKTLKGFFEFTDIMLELKSS
jgi:hypothetical protein